MAVAKKSITKKKPLKTLTVCISHKEDADGISSAALIKQAFGGKTVLVDYPGQMEALEEIAKNEKLKALYICDLGLNRHTQDRFSEILEGLRKRRVSVTYADHHDLDPKKRRLKAAKVNVIHDTAECISLLYARHTHGHEHANICNLSFSWMGCAHHRGEICRGCTEAGIVQTKGSLVGKDCGPQGCEYKALDLRAD